MNNLPIRIQKEIRNDLDNEYRNYISYLTIKLKINRIIIKTIKKELHNFNSPISKTYLFKTIHELENDNKKIKVIIHENI